MEFGPEGDEGSSFGDAGFEFAYALGVVRTFGFEMTNFGAKFLGLLGRRG